MPVPELNIRDFGMDTISLAGTLPAKLSAIRDAGFSQVMLSAPDLMGFDAGLDAAVRVVKGSGLRVTGFHVLRDFEGLSGHLHDYKIDVAKAMLDMCAAVGGKLLLVCSSTSTHARDDPDALARDLRKLAMLALPLSIKVAYEGLSWGRTINEFTTAWATVATTASRFSTTTTSRCPCPRWRRGHGARRSGWAKTCCSGRFRCRTRFGCAAPAERFAGDRRADIAVRGRCTRFHPAASFLLR